MTGIALGVSFSLFIVMLISVVLFGYIWFRSHEITNMIHAHVDGMAGDEGEEW